MRDESREERSGRRRFLRNTILAAGGYSLARIFVPGFAWASYREREIKSTAKLIGRITFEGVVPPPITRPVTSDFDVAGKEPRIWEGISVGKDRGVKGAIVVINGALEGKPFSAEKPETYVKGATILPRVGAFAWKDEAKLELENRDPILHSWVVRLKGEVKENRAHIKGAPPIELPISEPGLYELNCSPHPWERGFRMAVPHPYFAVTDEEGRFEISGLPQGDYSASLWAEGLNPRRIWVPVHKDTIELSHAFGAGDIGKALKEKK